ncbi:retrovirus-related pol polyprotein from transposon TNT 1-94 [Tanacetum coccineum]
MSIPSLWPCMCASAALLEYNYGVLGEYEDYYSNNQYAVSFKEDTAYLCLHSPKTTKDTRPIRRIQERQYVVFKLYGNKIFWKISNVVPTPRNSNTPLLLEKNVAYNIVNDKTTYGLFKALSNMYKKPSASNKVFLIRQLVNTKMQEGASVADHVNEFNSILLRLMSDDIKFDDEVQTLLLLSSLYESWSSTVTAVSGSTGTTKLKFDNIHELIIREDIRRKTSREYLNSLLSAEDKGRGRKQDRGQKQNRGRSKSKKRGQSKIRQDITCWNCNQKGHFQNQCLKPVASKDKEVHMAVRDYDDDALVYCVENTIKDRIIDSGASFHVAYCKEELERFKLRSGKVRLVDDITLNIAGVGDVVLKTSFGTSWTMKDVRYITGLNKRLISIGQLDEEGYHVGFEDQQWKVTKGSLVIRENKCESLYMVEVPSDGINAAIDGRGNVALWHQRLGYMSEKGMKILALKEVFNTFKKWKAVVKNETNLRVKCLKFDNGGEYSSREFIEYCAENRIRMLKTVLETPQQNGVAERMNRTLNERAKIKVKDIARDKLDAKSMKSTFIGYGSDEIGHHFWDLKGHKAVRSRDVTFNEDSLYGAKTVTYSSNLTKPNHKDQVLLEDSPQNIANKSIVAEHGSLEDYGRSDKEDSEDGAFFNEGGFETPQGVDYNEIFSPVVKMTTIRLVLSIVAAKDLYLEQLDVKTAFLHVALDEDIYMTPLEGSDMAEIKKLKRQLSQEFEMKDLGSVNKILGMSIIRDKMKGTQRLSQEKYIGKVLEKFNMNDAEARCQPLGDHFKLSKKQAPKTEASRRRMAKVPYASAVGSVIKRRAFWSLNEDILKITILKTNTPYPSKKIRRIRACTHQRPQKDKAQYAIWNDEDVHDLRSVETKFPAIVFIDNLSSNEMLSCEPTICSLNDNEIDFRISFDESDNEDYTIVFDKNSFSYKIISTNDLKMDSENDNEKVNMPLFPSPEPSVSCIDDLDFFKDFENEFPAIVYNDALTFKSDFLTEPSLCPQHIDEFDLKDETSLSEYDEVEQNILYFNDLFPFNIIYPDDQKLDKDNDDNEIDMIRSSRGGAKFADPAPIQAPQSPPPPPAACRTMTQRLGRLEEEMQGLQ